MMAVIFEVRPNPDTKQAYLDLAGEMRALLEGVDGFISIERFESLSEPGKLLSLSFWESEEAVENWRTLEAHRKAQEKGRADYFLDYRLRVADVVRDYGKDDRADAPADSKEWHVGG